MTLYMNTYDDRGASAVGRKQEECYAALLKRSQGAGHDGYNRYEGLMCLRRGKPDTDEPDFVMRIGDEQIRPMKALANWKVKKP